MMADFRVFFKNVFHLMKNMTGRMKMAFYKEKIDIAFQAMQENDLDMWIVAGQESATNPEPIMDILGDGEFIGCTALIFSKEGTSAVVCTPLDRNGYIHAGVFDEVIDFPVKFEQSVGMYIQKSAPKNIRIYRPGGFRPAYHQHGSGHQASP